MVIILTKKHNISGFADINSNFSQYRGQQGVRLNLRYNFSKGERFRVQSRSGSEEERRRLGGDQ